MNLRCLDKKETKNAYLSCLLSKVFANAIAFQGKTMLPSSIFYQETS